MTEVHFVEERRFSPGGFGDPLGPSRSIALIGLRREPGPTTLDARQTLSTLKAKYQDLER